MTPTTETVEATPGYTASPEYIAAVTAPIQGKKPEINGAFVAEATMIERKLAKTLDKYRAKVSPQAALAGVTMLQARLSVMLADISGKPIEDIATEVTTIYSGMVPQIMKKG